MNLDSQQIAAVETDSRRALVLAGAGSGKTRVLIERIAYLIEEKHVSPFEIMAFTFTRKAAGEIKGRLEGRLGHRSRNVTLGTMHALALSMVNRFGEAIGLKSRAVTVYSSWEENFLLQDVAGEMGLFNGKAWKIPKKDILAVFDAYCQRGEEPAEDNPVGGLFRAFIQRCRENNSLTYGGLLIGLRLLIPTMGKYLPIRHILVDEVQDIDRLQWAIILEMAEAFDASVFLVGDVDQSIYEWRGAAPKYLVDHQDNYDIYRLEANYRSMPGIVTCANRLIGHNRDRITKTMTAARAEPPERAGQADQTDRADRASHADHGEAEGTALPCQCLLTTKATRAHQGETEGTVSGCLHVLAMAASRPDQPGRADHGEAHEPALPCQCVLTCRDMDSEAIAGMLGRMPRDIPAAVLARNHFLLEKIDRLMDEAKIPHAYIGKNGALTDSEPFRRFHAFLKLCVNPNDNFSFLLIKDVLGLAREVYGAIRVCAAQEGKGHFEVWRERGKQEDVALFTAVADGAAPCGLPASVDFAETVHQRYPGLSPETAAFIRKHPAGNGRIEAYLAWLATYEIHDEMQEETPGAVLMTIHAAKGLEWPVVVVAGCNEGMIPSKQAVACGELEAERRLMYVAMTRARDRLVLAVRPERFEDAKGCQKECPESRFIAEADISCLPGAAHAGSRHPRCG